MLNFHSRTSSDVLFFIIGIKELWNASEAEHLQNNIVQDCWAAVQLHLALRQASSDAHPQDIICRTSYGAWMVSVSSNTFGTRAFLLSCRDHPNSTGSILALDGGSGLKADYRIAVCKCALCAFALNPSTVGGRDFGEGAPFLVQSFVATRHKLRGGRWRHFFLVFFEYGK